MSIICSNQSPIALLKVQCFPTTMGCHDGNSFAFDLVINYHVNYNVDGNNIQQVDVAYKYENI